ncbi:PTS glucose transporter subunit IIA [Thermophilibacter sp. ET337]|uniref:PTS glucose transporter subunit IIA n=1 Tax=Thermophilibacter sp. ET337 TaxID=2973084 RepID=UPI0021AD3960|nr:PTS glucose transporter subunit IIA [Thermophilibacter sp. ET337]MCR8907796.1 PTS glucose transporter subunit IIA [Thermophilibacter sp. ET337]
MKYEKEGKELLALVGGRENVSSIVHCATRLRFELADDAKAKKDAIERLPYVLKVIVSGGQFQVVIGAAVHDYHLAVLDAAGMSADEKNEGSAAKKKQSPADVALKLISGSFSPLIPVMAGSGMVKALLTLLVTFGVLSDASSTYLVLSAAGNACFYFFPVLLGYTVSNQLGANPFVGAAIGAALLEPNFTGLVGVAGTDFLGIELLIHIGMDTVELKGEGITALVAQGDAVRAGQPLMKLDRAFLDAHGVCLDTPVIVTNPDAMQRLVCSGSRAVAHGDEMMTVVM